MRRKRSWLEEELEVDDVMDDKGRLGWALRLGWCVWMGRVDKWG